MRVVRATAGALPIGRLVLVASKRTLSRRQTLVVPSAPDASFFAAPASLRHLSVDAGYDLQGFIANLAVATNLPFLVTLEFGEYAETYMEDFASRVTPLAQHERLFRSPLLRQLRTLEAQWACCA